MSYITNSNNRRLFIKRALKSTAGVALIPPIIKQLENEKDSFISQQGGNSFSYLQSVDEVLPPLLKKKDGSVIDNLLEWGEKRNSLRQVWLDYLGEIPSNNKPPVLSIVSENKIEDLIIQEIEYEGEPGVAVRAYLITPNFIRRPLPGIVAFHSTSDSEMRFIAGIEKGHIVPFGFRIAKQGFVVICPQCFLWADSSSKKENEVTKRFHERHPGSKGMAKMLFDGKRAVDVLERLSYVDSNRIGALGHSLGAKEVLYLAAFDDRVKVGVSNEGGIGIRFSNWDAPWYLGSEIRNFDHMHHEVLALIAPRPFLLIGGESADGEKSRSYINAVSPVYEIYGEKKQNLEFYNHGHGHSPTPYSEKLTYNWMIDHFL